MDTDTYHHLKRWIATHGLAGDAEDRTALHSAIHNGRGTIRVKIENGTPHTCRFVPNEGEAPCFLCGDALSRADQWG